LFILHIKKHITAYGDFKMTKEEELKQKSLQILTSLIYEINAFNLTPDQVKDIYWKLIEVENILCE